MLSPRLRQQINELWTRFWSSGLTNPITAIEQITYLLFLKQLEALDDERKKRGYYTIYGRRQNCPLEHHPVYDVLGEKPELPLGVLKITPADNYCDGHNSCSWDIIKQAQQTYDIAAQRNITPHEHLTKYVFPWLRELDKILSETTPPDTDAEATHQENSISAMMNAPMENAAFQLPPDKLPLLQYAISTIDELFKQVGRHSANYDLMGDVFEHMLDEIQTSGKNGQFRTPRHIIRFMIELLDPKPGDSIVDPAAGTCGFLINSILHLRKKDTPKENLRLEWDGTPHNAYGSNPALEKALKGKLFTGFENDQTMARIGWMNMVLHGVEKPNIIWRDSLSKKLSDDESNSYDFAFANPPYTGSVDRSDLHESPQRFPRTNKGPITDKSELLFVWLILDLLRIGGEAAVIVPEGVLFGSTGAHRELRRQLLMENRLEAVISLPAGVFQPYTGVKTSILVFQKMNEKLAKGEDPTTREVWFYEITADGRSLDARRNQRPEENDLWDAQEKYERWFDKSEVVEPTVYFKPDYFMERWRDVDEKTLQIFPELAHERDKREGIHELFPELNQNPAQATEQVSQTQSQRIVALYQRYLSAAQLAAVAAADTKQTDEQKRDAVQRSFDRYAKDLDRLFRDVAEQMLESLPEKAGFKNYANAALKFVRDEVQQDFNKQSATLVTQILEDSDFMRSLRMLDEETLKQTLSELHDAAQPEVETIVREFAKLDGYDVLLRSHELNRFEEFLPEGQNWSARVRVWRRNDEWMNEDSTLTGSHDEDGGIRREYLEDEDLYNKDGTVKAEFLEPDCIEANDLNISAGRYKPFVSQASKVEKPETIIKELQEFESRIQQGLERLLEMVGSEG